MKPQLIGVRTGPREVFATALRFLGRLAHGTRWATAPSVALIRRSLYRGSSYTLSNNFVC